MDWQGLDLYGYDMFGLIVWRLERALCYYEHTGDTFIGDGPVHVLDFVVGMEGILCIGRTIRYR